MEPRSLFRGSATQKTVMSPQKKSQYKTPVSGTHESKFADLAFVDRVIKDVSSKVGSRDPAEMISVGGATLFSKNKIKVTFEAEIAMKNGTNPDDTLAWKSVKEEGSSIATSAMRTSGNNNKKITPG